MKKSVGDSEIQDELKIKSELKIYLMNNLCKIGQEKAEAELEEIERYLDEHTAAKNAEKVKTYIKDTETLEGNFHKLDFGK